MKVRIWQGVGRGGEGGEDEMESESGSVVSLSNSATPWTVSCQAPLSTEFSRPEYWSGLPFPSPGDLLSPGIEHRSPALQADSLPPKPPGKETTDLINTTVFTEFLVKCFGKIKAKFVNNIPLTCELLKS